MREGGLTVGGFLQLQQLALEDEEGGEDEVRETLTSMGYNEALELVKVFKLKIYGKHVTLLTPHTCYPHETQACLTMRTAQVFKSFNRLISLKSRM